jgi:hypothetical protein
MLLIGPIGPKIPTVVHELRRDVYWQLLRTKSVCEFVFDNSLEAAAETRADRRTFVLGAGQFQAFVAAFDAAPKPRPRLERLFAEPSVLSERFRQD